MRINYSYIKSCLAYSVQRIAYRKRNQKLSAIRYPLSARSGQAVLEFVFFVLFLVMFISFISFTHLISQGSSEINLVARSRIMAKMIGPGFTTIHEPESGRQERVDNTIGYRDEEREERDRETIINDSENEDTSHMAVIKLEDPEQTLEQRIYAKAYVGFGSIAEPAELQSVIVDSEKVLNEPRDINEFMQSEFTYAAEGYTKN